MSSILQLEPIIKNYAWGNDYFISNLLGIEKNGPMAELWMGSHRQGSSIISQSGEKLCDYLDKNPNFCNLDADSFPYLLKVLAIADSLSIQCHPDAKQAKEGYENEIGEHLNYQDPNPKAEMLYALTDTVAMCGFRSYEEAVNLLKIAVPNYYNEYLRNTENIFSLFDTIYRTDKDILEYAEAELLKNSELLPALEKKIILDLGDRHFGDPGVFAPLFLNIIQIKRGEAIYLKPRVLHAYVSGNGIELMNNSDNVLRAGLTKKHMDLDELEKIIIREPYKVSCMESFTDCGGVQFVCQGGFTLTVMENGSFVNNKKGAKILFCVNGDAIVNKAYKLSKGQCIITSSNLERIEVEAENSLVFMASSN